MFKRSLRDESLRLLSSAPAAATAAAAAGTRENDFGAGSEPQLPLRHHGFTQRKALIDDHVLIDSRSSGDGPLFHRAVLLDDIDIGTVLPRLDGFVRYDQGIVLHGEPQSD